MNKIKNEIKDLNKAFILIKRYNTDTLYWDGSYKGHTRQVRHATIIWSQEQAEKQRDLLNGNRKKLKYRTEPANKYFISSVEANIMSYTEDPYISITNRIFSLEQTIESKRNIIPLDGVIQNMLTVTVEQHKIDAVKRMGDYVKHCENKITELYSQIAEHNKQKVEYLAKKEKIASSYVEILQELKELDVETLNKSISTPAAISYKLFYGKKTDGT